MILRGRAVSDGRGTPVTRQGFPLGTLSTVTKIIPGPNSNLQDHSNTAILHTLRITAVSRMAFCIKKGPSSSRGGGWSGGEKERRTGEMDERIEWEVASNPDSQELGRVSCLSDRRERGESEGEIKRRERERE